MQRFTWKTHTGNKYHFIDIAAVHTYLACTSHDWGLQYSGLRSDNYKLQIFELSKEINSSLLICQFVLAGKSKVYSASVVIITAPSDLIPL